MADRLGFVVTPRTAVADAPVASLGGTTWAVMRESKHYDLSLEILRMTMDLETVEAFCRKELQISALHSVNRRLVKQGGDWMQAVVPLLVHAQPRPMLENYVQFSRILQQMFEMVLVDDLPVELAVRQVDRTLRLILSG
jgi:maltose-binding protein MalE